MESWNSGERVGECGIYKSNEKLNKSEKIKKTEKSLEKWSEEKKLTKSVKNLG